VTAEAGDATDDAMALPQVSVRHAAAGGCALACAIVAAVVLIALVGGASALWWNDHSAKDAYQRAPARDEEMIERELPVGSSKDEVLAFLARHRLLVTGDYDSVKEVTAVQGFEPLLGTCRVELDFGFDESWTLTGHAIRVHPCIYPWSMVV
jgi:hypothetical protein